MRQLSKKILVAGLNVFIMVLVSSMVVPGMYASIDLLLKVFAGPEQQVDAAFACADSRIV